MSTSYMQQSSEKRSGRDNGVSVISGSRPGGKSRVHSRRDANEEYGVMPVHGSPVGGSVPPSIGPGEPGYVDRRR
jgi:hypothetical protein